jgi:hypothetical protein
LSHFFKTANHDRNTLIAEEIDMKKAGIVLTVAVLLLAGSIRVGAGPAPDLSALAWLSGNGRAPRTE